MKSITNHSYYLYHLTTREHVHGNNNECTLSHVIQISPYVLVSGQALFAGAGAAQC